MEHLGLGQEPTSEANGDRVGSGPRLQLGQQVPDVRLDCLLRQEQQPADLPVDETLRDQLEDFDLPLRRLLLELLERRLERDHLAVSGRPPRRSLIEAAGVVHVTVENGFAFGRIHGYDMRIGRPRLRL